MPIHMGVVCAKCRRVHFIGTSSGVQVGRGEGMYLLTCAPPCSEVSDFRRESMRPYHVSDEAFQRGYADVDEYQIVSIKPQPEPAKLGDKR